METIRNFRDLLVWQRSMTLAEMVYKATVQLPKSELYGLVSQMRRAAVSIPSNIAEGHSRNSTGEYLQFLGVAKGSLAELESQMELASRLGWLDQQNKDGFMKNASDLARMLNALMTKLRSRS